MKHMIEFDISTVAARKAFVELMKTSAITIHAERVEGTNFTIVIAEFMDGWQIQDKSVCVNAADYNMDMGIQIAMKNIMSKADIHYWRTVGYLAHIGMTKIEIPMDSLPETVDV